MSSNLTWRIHAGLIPGREAEVRSCLAAFGDRVDIINGRSAELPPPPSIAEDAGALALTTVQDARRLLGKWRAIPGLYFDEGKYSVSFWMPRVALGIPVLNRGALFVPSGLLAHLQINLPRFMGSSGIFLRPDSGLKPFAGFVVEAKDLRSWAELDEGLRLHAPHLSPEMMIVIAPGRMLDRIEWRFWIVNRRVVAYSPYSWDDGCVGWDEAPSGAREIAERMAANPWQPDIAYVVDVVADRQAYLPYCLNEINAASTSGLYGTPIEPLFDALRCAALDEVAGNLTVMDG